MVVASLVKRKGFVYGGKLLAAYILLALFLTAPALSYQWRSSFDVQKTAQSVAATKVEQPTNTETLIGKPVAIQFVRENKTLPVSMGQYSEALSSWTVAEKDVQWIQTGEKLVDGKPTAHAIFYGHATEAVLGTTRNLLPKDTIIITTENGTKLAYEYVSDETVVPTNLSVLSEKDANRLTLITCKGLNNEYRRLMKFQFVGVVK